jgi:nucleotide-binding universal stress UspA family protein
MTFANILLRVVPTMDQELERLLIAVDLAQRFQARLDGIFVILNGAAEAEWAKKLFERAVSRTSLDTTWRIVDGASSAGLSFHARRADLTILPPWLPGRDGEGLAPERVALDSGRPVLILPRAATLMSIGHKVLVGWDDTPEAARALHEAMPILAEADKVVVLTVTDEDATAPLIDRRLVEHLRHHGVSAEIERRTGDAAEEIAAESRRCDADMLVIGLHRQDPAGSAALDEIGRRFVRSARTPVFCCF